MKGFTLLEFMLSVALSGAIFVVLCLCYACFTKLHTDIMQGGAQLENIRFAVYFLYDYFHKLKGEAVLPMDKVTGAYLKIKEGTDGLKIRGSIDKNGMFSYFYLSEKSPGLNAFFYKEGENPRLEIMSGINQLKISYGIKCLQSNNVCGYLLSDQLIKTSVIKSIVLTFVSATQNNPLKIWRVYGAFDAF